MALTLSQVHYVSDSEQESEDEPVTKSQKRRKIDYKWIEKEQFSRKEEAQSRVDSASWAVLVTNCTKEGKYVTYYCKEHGKLCSARCKLFYPSDSLQVLYFENDLPHEGGKTKILTLELKTLINDLALVGVTKPNQILKAVRENGMPEPPKSALNNYLARRKRKQGNTHLNVSDFLIWCQRHAEKPDDDDLPFVIGYDCIIDENELQPISIHAVVSTSRLLKILASSSNLHVDSTYKLNYEGYPVFIGGISDLGKHFHPCFIMLSSGESAEDYKFAFQALLNSLPEYCPSVLVADAAEAITVGFREVIGDGFLRVTCWAHVNPAYEKRLICIKDKAVRNEINKEIHLLQVCSDPDVFKQASLLWLKKWQRSSVTGVTDFVSYFKAQWLDNNYGWYEGYAPQHPSTNNGLESCNRVVKDEDTLRSRLPLGKRVTSYTCTVT